MKFTLTKLRTSALLLALLSGTALVAQSQVDAAAPRKVDSYGALGCDDAMARLDNFAILLQSEPHSQGYIVVYGERNGLPGKVLSYRDFAKDYLVKSRGVPAERLTTLTSYGDHLSTEFWIAPKNAPLPVKATAIEWGNNLAARKFDEGFADFNVFEGKPNLWTSDLCGLLGEIYLEAYAERLRTEPNSIGHIIIYTGTGRYAGPGRRSYRVRIVTRLLRDRMMKEHKIESNRIVIVYGGRRQIPEAELWVVPKGVAAPKPSPKTTRLR
jgi:hypothetical protein